jgi:hypothetical protein
VTDFDTLKTVLHRAAELGRAAALGQPDAGPARDAYDQATYDPDDWTLPERIAVADAWGRSYEAVYSDKETWATKRGLIDEPEET